MSFRARDNSPTVKPFCSLNWTVGGGDDLNVHVVRRGSGSSGPGASFRTLPSQHQLVSNNNANREAFAQCEQVWKLVMEFLPWRKLMELRRVSRLMLHQSLAFVSVSNMRCTNLRGLFIACHADLDSAASKAADATEVPKVSAAKRDPTRTRMFLGQLRRNGTVRMVEWLVNYVFDAPRGALVSVENHRNANTGRGKGCAWPTIADDATVNRLLLAHHRLFYDSVNGVEGVWLVARDKVDALTNETDMCNKFCEHVSYMPRSSIVVEAPRGTTSSATGAASVSTATKNLTPPRDSTSNSGSSQSYSSIPRRNLQLSLSSVHQPQQQSFVSGANPQLSLSNVHQPQRLQLAFPPVLSSSSQSQPQSPGLRGRALPPSSPHLHRSTPNTQVPFSSTQSHFSHHHVLATSISFSSPMPPKGAAMSSIFEEPELALSPALSVSSDSDRIVTSPSMSSSKVFLKDGSWRHNPYQLLHV